MSKITEALDDGLKDVVKAGEEGGEGLAKHLEETGTRVGDGATAHAETEVKNTEELTKAGSKPADPVTDAKPKDETPEATDSTAGLSAEDKAKAEAEEAARAAALKAKVAELRSEGHAPQRHLDSSDDQLKGRLGQPLFKRDGKPQTDANGYVVSSKKMDPARTDALSLPDTDPLKYKDMYTADASGALKNHKCGAFATKFGDEESLAKADAASRAAIPAGATGRISTSIDAKAAIGDDGMAKLSGKYIDPANPADSAGNINYKDVDFTGSTLTGVFDHDPATGKYNLVTLYPEPDKAVNP
ncbi:hypothetical protein KDK95_17445 [Actinospica sp. MGRD01-02]|uniref:Uncharacterized protein n=1 Tax=Actinospica acidithermotolerans TaxID=2828514 RepID=A0A941EAR5_9ACTN|nr:hypothetical protein [Actinospica acidithermotolerans]MBR7828106.1 hypothetical protein [Actinospica acidithermotolerans]